MKVREVLVKYHQIVPFPWSDKKIKKAGLEPMELCREIGQEIGNCEDKDTPSAKAILDILKKLEVMP
ncbi:hypothetical protein ES703_105855 [subsurface metagenome]